MSAVPNPDLLARLGAPDGPLWPEGLGWGQADPGAAPGPLYAVEEAAVIRAVAGRRAEFAAGRAAARAALAAIGVAPQAIPMAEDRAPVWPAGTTGSISHIPEACLAVAAPAGRAAGLGLDLEVLAPLEPDLAREIGRPEELAALGGDPGLAARRLFSMKEAAYKAQYALSRTLFGFHTLVWDGAAGGLRFVRRVPPFAEGALLPVRRWEGAGLCLSLVLLPEGAVYSGSRARAGIMVRR
ncbi:4'-phosphopantetheinyl transferase family protein [Roseivivax sp. CAU 1761]